MSPRERSRLLTPAVAVILLVLLAALATLQHRWTGRISAMERQHLQARLVEDAARFAEDFDREVTRTFLHFQPELPAPPGGELEQAARALASWRAEAPWPGFVRDLLAVRRSDGGGMEVWQLEPGGSSFEKVDWPAELAGLRERLAEGPAAVGPLAPDIPALVIPQFLLRRHTAGEEGFVLIVRLDTAAMESDVFPELARRHFGSGRYMVAVLDDAKRPVFLSDPGHDAEGFRGADARAGLLDLRPFHELHGMVVRKRIAIPRHGPPEIFRRIGRGPREREPAWELAVQHRAGSLEAAVARVRMHNLAISLGILALLALTVGLMLVAAQRAQRLARQQIELVASVTHELHTPLTAIRSAGQNLADGVVADAQQVRRYGTLIEREGRRLTDMVGQVLELAGIQSGRRGYRLRPEPVAEVVDAALEDCRGLLAETQVRIEREIPPDLPPLLADREAVRRALRNLIENAVRHGGAAGWVGVRARRAGDGVEITVADRGPGIPREDLPHLFEPFYRGRDALARSIPGSGLGLSVVRAVAEGLGGRVTVEGAAPGSAFTLHLPAVTEGAA